LVLARIFSKPFFLAFLLWILIVAALYLLTDLLFMPYLAGKFKGTVKVPILVSLPPEQAKDILGKNGLIYMLDSTGDYSTDVAAGKILSQYPIDGTVVKKGRRVWVKISKGFKSVELPSLRGLSLRQAEITLQQLGLRMGRVSHVRHASIPAGAVIGSVPPARTTLEKDRAVNVEVSDGKDATLESMPSLIGISLGQARKQIKTMNLPLGKITYKKDKHSLPGSVMSQTPSAGVPLSGQTVDLVISK
jgi:beta-lactam-binding protein with PASTA domain